MCGFIGKFFLVDSTKNRTSLCLNKKKKKMVQSRELGDTFLVLENDCFNTKFTNSNLSPDARHIYVIRTCARILGQISSIGQLRLNCNGLEPSPKKIRWNVRETISTIHIYPTSVNGYKIRYKAIWYLKFLCHTKNVNDRILLMHMFCFGTKNKYR